MKTTTSLLQNPIGPSPALRAFILIALALAWFALSPNVRAVTPAPDGGYLNNNTAEGTNALNSLTTGFQNTAIGFQALFKNTDGSHNTATGFEALASNISGVGNTANGFGALTSNTTINGVSGNDNTATGWEALLKNTIGIENTANGSSALESNTTGSYNTATGYAALIGNTTGSDNTANGLEALFFNTTGSNNTADGIGALEDNTNGSNNAASGAFALQSNTTGHDNTAEGFQALGRNTTGLSNIAVGSKAGGNLTTGSNNIDIGNSGVAGEAKKIRIGTVGTQTATFIAGIRGVTVAGGVGVIVGTNGQLGTPTSSERFKEAIKPMDKASEAILALKPVTFHYKDELDPEGIPQFGLVAEQVEKVNPDLVARDEKGQVYTVRYEAVNAMLLNEFLKARHKVQEHEATIAQLESNDAQQQQAIKALAATVKEQALLIQKVNDRVELSRPAPQAVANDPR